MVLTNALVFFGYDRRFTIKLAKDDPAITPHSFKLNFNWGRLKRLTLTALPLGGVILSTTLQINVPRYFIDGYLGSRALGIFVALSYLLVVGQTFVLALVKPSSTTLSRYYTKRNKRAFLVLMNRLLLVVATIGFLGVATSWLFGKIILEILYKPEYSEHVSVFVILMLAGGIRQVGVVLGAVNTACKALKEQTIPAITELVAITATCWIFVPRYGLHGAAYALLALSVLGASMRFRIVLVSLRKLDQEPSEEEMILTPARSSD